MQWMWRLIEEELMSRFVIIAFIYLLSSLLLSSSSSSSMITERQLSLKSNNNVNKILPDIANDIENERIQPATAADIILSYFELKDNTLPPKPVSWSPLSSSIKTTDEDKINNKFCFLDSKIVIINLYFKNNFWFTHCITVVLALDWDRVIRNRGCIYSNKRNLKIEICSLRPFWVMIGFLILLQIKLSFIFLFFAQF